MSMYASSWGAVGGSSQSPSLCAHVLTFGISGGWGAYTLYMNLSCQGVVVDGEFNPSLPPMSLSQHKISFGHSGAWIGVNYSSISL